MGVPQKRERTFFIASRKDLDFGQLKIKFDEKPIMFGEVRQEHGDGTRDTELKERIQKYFRPGDRAVDEINKRIGKTGAYTNPITPDNEVSPTVTANGQMFRACDKLHYHALDFVSSTSFPQDYNFGDQKPQYITGMSVPPVMMAQVATEVYNQWLRT